VEHFGIPKTKRSSWGQKQYFV